jgi:hypothetical protein
MRRAGLALVLLATVVIVMTMTFQWSETQLPVGANTNSLSVTGVPGAPAPLFPRGHVLRQPPAPAAPLGNFNIQEGGLATESVESRGDFAAELGGKSAHELLAFWLAEIRARNDPLKLDFIGDTLARSLRVTSPDSAGILGQIGQLILDTQNDDYLRWRLVGILGEAATQDTLQLLLDLVNAVQQQDMRSLVLTQVAKAAGSLQGGRYHPEFSPPLERAWMAAGVDSDALQVLAGSIAAVGAPSGLNVLFSEITKTGGSVNEFQKGADSKGWAAFAALSSVRNPSVVPYLDAELNQSGPDSITTAAAGYALANMGKSQATSVLLQWVEGTPTDVGSEIRNWFALMRDPGSVQMAQVAVKQSNFALQGNRDSLQNELATLLSHLSRNLQPPAIDKP